MGNRLIGWLAVCVLWWGVRAQVQAQYAYTWEQFEEDYLHNPTTTEDNGTIDEDLLRDLLANPININTAEREDLEQLPFLDDEQISALLAYRQYNNLFLSLGELLLVWRIDRKTRNYLSLFVYCGEGKQARAATWRERLLSGKHELSARMDLPLYNRQGQRRTDETAAHARTQWYLGNKYYHNVKYGYNYKNQLRYGIQMEKDAGEPFAQWGNKGFDAYSAHASYKTEDGKWQVVLGDYRVHVGLGLVAGNGFMLSTKRFAQSRSGTTLRLSPHTSTSEASYLRGAALVVKPKAQWQVLLYGAANPTDALLDSVGHIRSLSTSGLHRTYQELQRKHVVCIHTTGIGVQHGYGRQMVWGVTANVVHYSHPFAQRLLRYEERRYPAQTHFNLSAYYLYHRTRWQLAGEVAMDKQGDWACLQTAQLKLANTWHASAVARYYAAGYQSYLSKAPQSGGRVQNELGLRLALSGKLMPYLLLDAYADGYYQPEQSTTAAAGTWAGSVGVSLEWQARDHWQWQMRYALNTRKRNVVATHGSVQALHTTQQWRVQMAWELAPTWGIKSSVGVRAYHSPRDGLHWGASWSTTCSWKPSDWRIAVSTALFSSPNGYTRLSAYEPALRYMSGATSFSQRGVRLNGVVEYLWRKCLGVGGKIGWTHYWGIKAIGTGPQQIRGQDKADISLQLRALF